LEALVEKLQSQSIQEPPIIPECEQELELQPTSLQTPIAVREYNVEPAMVATEEEARSKRKNFSLETKLQIIKKQVCRDSDFDFLLHDEILPLDYDHIEDRTNNSEDNCQALCVISHAIKTRKPNVYKKITNDKESFIINLLNCLTSSKIFLKMYREGKVCLSILGTWQGPEWASTMRLSTVLVTLQSLMDTNPIVHEPGYSNPAVEMRDGYVGFVEYACMKYILDRAEGKKPVPEQFVPFQQVFTERLPGILSRLEKRLLGRQEKSFNNLPYQLQGTTNYAQLLQRVLALRQ
jgi:hypothetical protein